MHDSAFYISLETSLRVPKPGELSGSRVLKTSTVPKAKTQSPFDATKTWATKNIAPKLVVPNLKGIKYGMSNMTFGNSHAD
jgi:hypothetical protein